MVVLDSSSKEFKQLVVGTSLQQLLPRLGTVIHKGLQFEGKSHCQQPPNLRLDSCTVRCGPATNSRPGSSPGQPVPLLRCCCLHHLSF